MLTYAAHSTFNPHLEWVIPAFTSFASPHFDRYSFFIPLRVEGWVGLLTLHVCNLQQLLMASIRSLWLVGGGVQNT